MRDFLRPFRRRAGAGPRQRPAAIPEPTLPFPFVTVPGADALRERSALRSRPGITPVLLGDRDDVRTIEGVLQDSPDARAAILRRAETLDVAGWLRSVAESDPGHYSIDAGSWPAQPQPAVELSAHLDTSSRRPKPLVIIGLVPTPRSWEVPAFLGYGGWNACPLPEAHVAIHRQWNRDHGAEIACVAGDVIECTVERPPSSPEAALRLAREQFVYCSDIVHQGVGSLEALAATLLRSRAWYFWWD